MSASDAGESEITKRDFQRALEGLSRCDLCHTNPGVVFNRMGAWMCKKCFEEERVESNIFPLASLPPSPSVLDLTSTPELIAALDRRFDVLVFAGTILLVDGPQGKQEQRVVRRKGHDLVQTGLVQLLIIHCQPQELPADKGQQIGGGG